MMYMRSSWRILTTAFVLLVLVGSSPILTNAKTKEGKDQEQVDPEKEAENGDPELQRLPQGAFESVRNKVSDIDFYSTNYGILFLNVRAGAAGGLYPRNGRPYMFGGGIWFGAKKLWPQDPSDPNSELRLSKRSVISYNPNSGVSWMVPGEVTQPYAQSAIDQSQEAVNKYRIYFSTDYSSFTGEPFDEVDIDNGGPNWPIWDTDPDEEFLVDRYVGRYVSDVAQRNRGVHSKGPAVVSGEDIVSIFKDTDLSRYEIGKGRAQEQGYPLGLEFDQRIYTWGFGQYSNFIFIRYSIVNKSSDTLYECYVAPALDTDIGAASNDRMRIAIPEENNDSLDLGVQWSETSLGDQGFGYMGADFLESPAVYPPGHPEAGFIRKDKKFYENDEQLGLHALRNWIISIDPKTPEERYNFMAEPTRDGDNGPGDKRFLQSTGPFNMLPNDTARVVVAILIAPAKSNNPNGEWEDMDSLIKLDLFAQKVYDENFLAPRPPDPANVDWRPLDNGVELTWDETSENSLDEVEKGLDFGGYLIQRSRKDASGGDVIKSDSVVGYNIGYKTIARFDIPPFPTELQRVIAGQNQNLRALGAWWRLPMLADTVPLPGTSPPVSVAIQSIDCYDTLKREGGLGDTIIVRPGECLDTIYGLSWDPFDDESDDSTQFNDISGKWWNDGSWGDQFSNKATRDIVRDAINAIMDSVTNGRSFIDVGDDDGNGTVESSSVDLRANEKLVNNIDYYYQVLAFDEGSREDNTPQKVNSGIAGINEVRATPEAPPAGRDIEPEIVSSEGLGGLSNFKVIVYDKERLGQLFGGDTLEFEFQPFKLWNPGQNRLFRPLWYTNEIIVRSKELGELNRFVAPLVRGDITRPVFADRANNTLRNLDSTFISRFVYFQTGDFDTNNVPIIDSIYTDRRHVSAQYRNTFTTEPGRFLYGTNGVTKNTIGVSFDWTGIQYGDSLRFGKWTGDSLNGQPSRDSSILGHQAIISIDGEDTVREYRDDFNPFDVIDGPGGGTPNTGLIDGQVAYGNDENSFVLNRAIPSIGQVKLEIEFKEGGTETIQWQKKTGATYRAENIPYLVPVVRNVAAFLRDSSTGEMVEYNYEFPPDSDIDLRIDTASDDIFGPVADAIATFINMTDQGEFSMLAYDWTDTEGMSASDRRNAIRRAASGVLPSDRPIGTPNRYYVGEQTATNTETSETVDLRFTHRLVCNGAITLIDYAGMGDVIASLGPNRARHRQIVPDTRPNTDFQAGDKFTVSFSGGALGLPQPGAKVRVAIPDPTPGPGEFTDEFLDEVRVVPNPYLVDHLGQPTSGDKSIYFTRLPTECTIEIYTAAGELVQTIEHDGGEGNVEGRIAVNAWDMVTRGNRQAQSQLLIARITTPDGAETVKKFSIVVGGFRLFTR